VIKEKNKFRAVIFDLGGVYFKDALLSFGDLSKKEGFSSNRFLEVIRKKYFNKIEIGKMAEEDFWHRFKHDVGFKMPIAEAKSYFLSQHKPMPGMKELVRDVRKEVKVGLLTNNVKKWFSRIDKHYKISREFDEVIVSEDVKIRKPEKKIYLIMAKSLGVNPSECIFFDDYQENVQAASRFGFKAFKFISAGQVKKELLRLGFLAKTKKQIKKIKNKKNIKKTLTFKVNRETFKAIAGSTILKALGENNIYVPTLCYAPIFPPKANCRLCLVEVKNNKNLITACSTLVQDGMEIFTETQKVKKARLTNLKLLYQDHIGKCPTCVRLKNCELLRLVSKYKAGSADFKGEERKFKIDTSGAVVFDMNKCIKCRRCIEACKKYGSDVLEIKGRAFGSVVGTKNGKNLKNSGCISCLQCAQVCPVGAIYEKISQILT